MIELIFPIGMNFLMKYTRFQDAEKAFEYVIQSCLRFEIDRSLHFFPNFLWNSENCLEVFSKYMCHSLMVALAQLWKCRKRTTDAALKNKLVPIGLLYQSRICGKGVSLDLFPSDSLQYQSYQFIEIAHIGPYYGEQNDRRNFRFESYEQFYQKLNKVEKWLFFGHFWVNLGYVSHIPVIRFWCLCARRRPLGFRMTVQNFVKFLWTDFEELEIFMRRSVEKKQQKKTARLHK